MDAPVLKLMVVRQDGRDLVAVASSAPTDEGWETQA
jgi:hypothetical protein